MTVNYKNVYDLQDKEQAIFAAERKVAEAQKKVEEAKQHYREACAKAVGVSVNDLDFPNECCIAKGILHHVYHIKVRDRYGSPQNKCIFCECDNVDSLY